MSDHRRTLKISLILCIVLWSALRQLPLEAQEPPETASIVSVTTQDPLVSEDELALMLQPLTREELEVEASAWRDLVKAKAQEISQAEIAVKRKNRDMEAAKEISSALEEACQRDGTHGTGPFWFSEGPCGSSCGRC